MAENQAAQVNIQTVVEDSQIGQNMMDMMELDYVEL